RLRTAGARSVDRARLLDDDRAARPPAADVALHGPLDDLRRRLFLHGARLRDLRRWLQPREDRRRDDPRLRDLRRVRELRLVPRVAHRADAHLAHALDLRAVRLGDRLALRADRTARVGRLPGRADGSALARLL